MNYEEIIEKYKTEEGIDFENLNKDLSEKTQEQLNAVASKTKAKYKTRLEEAEKKLEELTNSNKEPNGSKDDDTDKFDILTKRIEKMQEELLKKNQEEIFKQKAKNLNVDDKILEQLLNSGANLEKIDLENFKKEEQAKIPDLGTNEGDGEEETETKEKELIKLFKFKK